MNIDSRLRAAIDRFEFDGELVGCEEITNGNVHRSYHLTYAAPDGGTREYVLQHMNTFAFKRPEEVMENVDLVTKHLAASMRKRGENPDNRVLHVVPVKGGGILLLDEDGNTWRAYDFITHAMTRNYADSPDQFREVGVAFGEFQTMLSDFPIKRLHDTIPYFHDTRRRLEAFERSVATDAKGRAAEVAEEIAFVRARKEAMCRIVDMIGAGELPLRVTHNDTKINNVMLNVDTGKAQCVIDLDTVMAGSSLYDFGDAIRFGASTALEDERDLSKVGLDLELFSSFAEGYISRTASGLTDRELENLSLGALVMTFEVGLRFLTDYLDGDVYFNIDYPDHNLIRARCQFKLLTDMEAKRGEMDAIVRRLIEKYR